MTRAWLYEALMRWLGSARRVMALIQDRVLDAPAQGGACGWQDVRVPRSLEILGDLGVEASAHLRFAR